MRDLFDEPISIVEELDPEPEPTGSWLHLREVLLGFLLLVGVLAWSGWEWWHQDQQQANYIIAQQAAADQDWDRALRYFSLLNGFKDSDARASEMNKLVTERDTQYEIASSAAEKGEWAATLQAAEAVRRVQRDYRDTNQLESQASWEVYRGGLEGVVAMRTQGRKPALYYRERDSWEWLPRSDRRSQILQTLDATGAIVYDVPGENWDQVKLTPTATPAPPSLRITGMPGLEGRAIWVARYGNNDGSSYFGVSFDPAEYNNYSVGENGMWAFQLGNRPGNRPRVMTSWGAIKIDYQAFGSSKVVPVDVQRGWTAMDFAPDGEHILLVDAGLETNRKQPLKVYVADGIGNNKKLLYSHEGSIQAIQFSPDSKYALLTMDAYQSGGTAIYRVVLVDVRNGAQQILIERTLPADVQRPNYPLPVAAGFFREGRFKGHALVTDSTGDPARIYLFVPGRPAALLNMQVDAVPTGAVMIAQDDDKTVLTWQQEPNESNDERPLVTLELGSDWTTHRSTMPIAREGFLAFWGMRNGWFLVGTAEVGEGRDRLVFQSLYSIPLAKMREMEQMPEPLYRAVPLEVNEFTFTRTMYPGRTMLAYIEKGELRVRTYDGKVDMNLENGVTQLHDPSFNASWVPLR